MIGNEVRLFVARQYLADQRLDRRQQLHFVSAHQRNRLALVARAPGAADTVHIVLGNDRQVEVDHQRQVVDVQATGGDIGGHQHLNLAGLEAVQRALAGRLGAITMDAVGVDALGEQPLDQLVHTVAGLGEHQHLLPALLAQQVAEQVGLALLVHRHQPLLDRAGSGIARADLDAQRIVQRQAREHADLVGEGGGEQQRLALARQRRVHRLQLFGEAQVEHAVGFVEHQGLHLAELDGVLAEQVEQAPRGGHQQVDAAAQAHHLRVDADPAVYRVGGQRQVLGVLAHIGVNLLGQLPGGYQHQRAHRVGGDLLALQGQALQHRQGEARGLAGAGLGRGHQVAAGEHGGNGLGLDRGRGGVVQCLQGAHQRFDQAEFGEIHGNTVRGSAKAASLPQRHGHPKALSVRTCPQIGAKAAPFDVQKANVFNQLQIA